MSHEAVEEVIKRLRGRTTWVLVAKKPDARPFAEVLMSLKELDTAAEEMSQMKCTLSSSERLMDMHFTRRHLWAEVVRRYIDHPDPAFAAECERCARFLVISGTVPTVTKKPQTENLE